MNVSDRVRVGDLVDEVAKDNTISESQKKLWFELIGRIDSFIQDIVLQLKAEPTIFSNLDPDVNTEEVEGAKTGDIAVFRDSFGDTYVSMFEE